MMTAITLREFKDRRYSLLAYCAIVVVLMVVYIAIFPSVKASVDQLQKLYASYPKGLYQALGIENLTIKTLEDFLAIELYSIVWPILALLFSTSLAGNTMAGQIEKGTIGFYLNLPISRVKLFFAKYLSGLANVLVFIVVSIMGIVPLAALFNDSVSVGHLVSLSALSLLFMLAVFSLSILLSAAFSERSKVYMVMGGILIIMYVANIIAGLKTGLSWLSHYSIFHYYNAQNVLATGHLRLSSILVFVVSTIVFTGFGIYLFRERDVAV